MELEGKGADVVILDTAPHSEGTALDAARAAELILVPCQPSIMDLRAMRKTTDLLKHIKKPTYAVLNGVSVQGSAALGTEKAIARSSRSMSARFVLAIVLPTAGA